MNFEPRAAETIGGAVPQVIYRASNGQVYVVWQGETVRYRDDADASDSARNAAETRIFEVIVGMFQDEQNARAARALMAPADEKPVGDDTAKMTRNADGSWHVSDGTFSADYADAATAARVVDWLADPADGRPIADVVTPLAAESRRPVVDNPQA